MEAHTSQTPRRHRAPLTFFRGGALCSFTLGLWVIHLGIWQPSWWQLWTWPRREAYYLGVDLYGLGPLLLVGRCHAAVTDDRGPPVGVEFIPENGLPAFTVWVELSDETEWGAREQSALVRAVVLQYGMGATLVMDKPAEQWAIHVQGREVFRGTVGIVAC